MQNLNPTNENNNVNEHGNEEEIRYVRVIYLINY